MKYKQLIGCKFGRLTVIDYSHETRQKNGRLKHYWKCKCDCGKIKSIYSYNFILGHTLSCGCLQIEKASGKRIKPKINAFKQLFNSYKSRAKIKKMIFDLSIEQFEFLTKQNCFYCNTEPNGKFLGNYEIPYIYTGIDRIDSNLGYVMENCRPACSVCNYMKTDLSEQEFFAQIQKIASHLQLDNLK